MFKITKTATDYDFDSIKPTKPTDNRYRIFGSNRRYKQPTLGEIRWMMESDGITSVIRTNGNGDDTNSEPQLPGQPLITKDLEKKFVEHMGGAYHYVDSHSPNLGRGVPGKGYVNSIAEANPLLGRGNTLIHCKSGVHRTGYLVNAFVMSKKKSNDNRVTKERLWEYMASVGGGWYGHVCGGEMGFIAYLEGFYPIDEWCAADKSRKSCAPCKGK